MTATATEAPIYFVPDLAERFGLTMHKVRFTIDKTGIGRRVGRQRVLFDADLPAFEIALRARGYLPPLASTSGR